MEITIPWTNDITCYARQFPRNPKGQYQTERDGAVASATPKGGIEIGTLPVGSKVKLTVNGTDWDFLIVHQGNPDVSLYDASCDGTWLLMEDIYESRQWNSSDVNDYENSTIHSYLNSTFLGLLDSDIQSAIKQVKLPYRAGSGYGTTITSGANGLAAKIFLLSCYEVGWTTETNSYFPADGACLSYFSGTTTTDAKRSAYLNDSASRWWLRSPYCYSKYGSNRADQVSITGSTGTNNCSTLCGIRPTLILNSNTLLLVEPNADGSYSLL
jgi:hypothetical protein